MLRAEPLEVAHEEEQTELFPIFEKLPKDERDEVAERLADRKRELAPEE